MSLNEWDGNEKFRGFNKGISLKELKENKKSYLNISPSFSTGGVPFRVCEFAAAFAAAVEPGRFVESCKDEFRAESGVFLSRKDCRTSPDAIDIRGLRLLTICKKLKNSSNCTIHNLNSAIPRQFDELISNLHFT